ncbi:SulP family inorganic anion transporter [Leptolyngbya cf. ectocarpi LEGE 11479]|uniref:SulP family inorganic anion transporter n=1 Tax=Leptolyngbya cf. ectocarpi LEGE 11479 TaxID=1828722 RepID=A0A928ZZ33_LEPEC|nr:SulP family inorganic anion transporter [Leptolyngbya ectocarpi]MBE9070066.1 SulP family inorganic anion transporter [Leptolyngbya cf. ectocarpi LEGE 11479]
MTFFLPKSLTWPTPASLVQELQPETLISSFLAGSITGLIGVIRAISYAALIFSGSLAVHLNVGVGIAIFSSAAISIVVTFMSSLPGMIATPLAAPTAVLAILAAQIASTLATSATSTELLVTVVMAISIGSIITGITLWFLGAIGGGNALQFIPYPVVGGFMAATGWLLVRGAVQVMTDEPLTFSHLAWFIEPDPLLHWGTGLGIAVILLAFTKRYQQAMVMPGILLAATGLFYGAVWQSHLPLTTIRAQGWLLGPFPAGNLWQPLTFSDLGQVHWAVIAQHSSTLGLLVFVSLLSLVLTNGGIELALGRDLDLNQELRAVGLANVIAGLGSTMAGNQALPSTLLVHKMGAASRLTGLFKALPCIAVLLLGPAFLAYFPKPILGSLLLFLGLELLWQWLYQIWFRLAWYDYLTIVVTLVVINRVDFIVGILVGLVMTAVQFLYQCTQTSPIEPGVLSGELDSQAVATAQSDDVKNCLDINQGTIDWIDLQGFLFFGNAASLFQQVRSHILHPTTRRSPDYLVLNFQSVLGIDASAVLSFSKLSKLARDRQLTLVFSQASEPLQQQLSRGQGMDLDSNYCLLCETQEQTIQAITKLKILTTPRPEGAGIPWSVT